MFGAIKMWQSLPLWREKNSKFQCQSIQKNKAYNCTAMAETRRKYHLHIDLDTEYEPFQKRGNKNRNSAHTTSTDIANMRLSGHKHIDLWCDGRLYPIDPKTQSHPPFSNPTNVLQFIGNGEEGFLGYCKAISSTSNLERLHLQYLTHESVLLREECRIQKQKLEEQKNQI